MKEQRVMDSWTWEEILDGKGPWRQAGEYRRPREELEGAKAERRRYEGTRLARKRGVWQSQVGDLSQLPVLTVAGIVLVRHRVMRWSSRCLQYAFLAQCAIHPSSPHLPG